MASRPRAADKRIKSGTQREALEAIRDELAKALANSTVGVKAQIAGQLRAVIADLASLPDVKKVSKADELARRREARLAKAVEVSVAAGEGN